MTIPQNALTASISPLYIICGFFFMAIAELIFVPIGLSSITKLSPKKYLALFIGVWTLCYGVASYFAGFIAGYITVIPKLWMFFIIFIIICIIPGILIFIFSKKLEKLYHKDIS